MALIRSAGSGRVRLRVVTPNDLGSLYQAALEPSRNHLWRFRGSTPSFDQFGATFNDGVLAQFAVVDRRDDRLLQGLVTAYNYDATNGHVYFAYLAVQNSSIRGALTEGLASFLTYLLAHFPLRHLYCEVPAFNEHLVAGFSSTGLFERVARYPDHLYSEGRYQDLFVYRVTREAWLERFGSWRFNGDNH